MRHGPWIGAGLAVALLAVAGLAWQRMRPGSAEVATPRAAQGVERLHARSDDHARLAAAERHFDQAQWRPTAAEQRALDAYNARKHAVIAD